MDTSLYSDLAQQLEYLIASEKPTAIHCVTTKSSRGGAQFVPVGLYQEEESVDFSALVEACELTSSSPHLTTSGSASFLDPSDTAFPFEADLLPTTSSSTSHQLHQAMFGTDNGSINAPLDLTLSGALNPSVTQSAIVMEMPPGLLATTTDLAMTDEEQQDISKCGNKRKLPRKGSHEYREKRDRNNLAVKKSRGKSKIRIRETEGRVKELEDENSRLTNKIALLSKELNVLKSLFSSAGVPQPPSLKAKEHAKADSSTTD